MQLNDPQTLYPFSARPTRHRVTPADGRGYYAMCAIDALGIPYMLGEAGEVQTQPPESQPTVRVTNDVDGHAAWTPVNAVAVAAFGDGRSLAQTACPHINLFASPRAAARYLDTHRVQGNILSITQAAEAGRWLFGDLLSSLPPTQTR